MKALLTRGISEMGLTVDPRTIPLLLRFHEELKKWGGKINLTSLLGDEKKVAEELFLDSLAPLPLLGRTPNLNESLLDIGSGGGFPGVPLAIAAPGLAVTLADTIEKKVFFLRHIVRTLPLPGTIPLRARFADEGAPEIEKESFRWAVSKAVAESATLAAWAHPHLLPGGRLICMKGRGEPLAPLQGYVAEELLTYRLPFSGIERRLLVYRKG